MSSTDLRNAIPHTIAPHIHPKPSDSLRSLRVFSVRSGRAIPAGPRSAGGRVRTSGSACRRSASQILPSRRKVPVRQVRPRRAGDNHYNVSARRGVPAVTRRKAPPVLAKRSARLSAAARPLRNAVRDPIPGVCFSVRRPAACTAAAATAGRAARRCARRSWVFVKKFLPLDAKNVFCI